MKRLVLMEQVMLLPSLASVRHHAPRFITKSVIYRMQLKRNCLLMTSEVRPVYFPTPPLPTYTTPERFELVASYSQPQISKLVLVFLPRNSHLQT